MYDLIIVGAGPAGTAAARVAAQQGLKTLLLEKEKIPRNKLCGGGVTPKVLRLLDFNLPTDLIECSVRSVRLHVGEDCHNFETDRTLTYMTSRAPFDAFLAEKAVEAGAELKDASRVRSVNVTESYAEVNIHDGSFRSHMIIGADGTAGLVAAGAQLYSHWSPDQVSYAIESEIPVGEGIVQEFIQSSGYFDLFFGASPAGYGWIFPKRDHLTVGVGCTLRKLRDGRGLFEAFVKSLPGLSEHHVPRPQAHLIPLGGAARVPTVGRRVLLAGDSAGFADPFFGEGIYFAILSGQIAGEVVKRACNLGKFDVEHLIAYRKCCRAAFGVDLDIAYRVARFSYLEQYDMERVARFFFAEKKVQECMIGLIDGSIRYRDARIKLAWPYFKYRLAKLGLPFYS